MVSPRKNAYHDMSHTQSPKLDDTSLDSLNEDISENKVWTVIKDLPRNKSPGSDGFTTEFYCEFWPPIKTHLMEAYKETLEEGSLTTTQKQGVITLIPKPQKDLTTYNPLKSRI